MKRVLIGGFLTVVGSLWALAIGAYVQLNLVSEWYGNRFGESASELGVTFPLVLSLIVLALGAVLMVIEYFRKDK